MGRWKRWRDERAMKRAVSEAEDFVRGKVSIRSITTLGVNLTPKAHIGRFDADQGIIMDGMSECIVIVKGELVDNEGNKRRWEVDFEGGKLDAFSIDQAPVIDLPKSSSWKEAPGKRLRLQSALPTSWLLVKKRKKMLI